MNTISVPSWGRYAAIVGIMALAIPASAKTGITPAHNAPATFAMVATVAKAPAQADEFTPQRTFHSAEYSSATTAASVQRVDWWFGSINWSQWPSWIGNWKNIAYAKIAAVRSDWKRAVLRQGMKAGLNGASAYAITRYYRSQGLYCPDKPWWLPAGPAWPILTCAESAR